MRAARVATGKILSIRNPAKVRAYVLDGLNYACASSDYLWPSAGSRRNFLKDWHGALLLRGFSLPFFFVLDLGLLFFYGSSDVWSGFRFTTRSNRHLDAESRPLCEAYYKFLCGLTMDEDLHKLCTATARDARRSGNGDPLDIRYRATPLFLERCLNAFDLAADWSIVLDPDVVLQVAGDEREWATIARRMAEGSDVLSKEERKKSPDCAGANLRFVRSVLESRSHTREKRAFSRPAEAIMLRAACASDGTRPLLDMTLLANYTAHRRISIDVPTGRLLRQLRRLGQTGVAVRSTRPSGGYEGITNLGAWSSLMRSQLALLDNHRELFLHRLVNGRLLFYDRIARQSRPLRILLALFADSDPAPAGWDFSNGAYLNTLTREIAAYLAEDVGRSLMDIKMVDLSIFFSLLCGGVGRDFLLLNIDDAQRSRMRAGGPLLSGEGGILSSFFRLLSPAAPRLEKKSVGGALSDLAKILCEDRDTLDLEEGREVPFDCIHLVHVAGTMSGYDPDGIRSGMENARLRALRVTENVFLCSQSGVSWPVRPRSLAAKDEEAEYDKIRSGSLRKGFTSLVIDEAVRALETV